MPTINNIEGKLRVADLVKRFNVQQRQVREWMRVGIRKNGERVRLASVKVAGRRYVEESAVQEFLARLNDEPASQQATETVSPTLEN